MCFEFIKKFLLSFYIQKVEYKMITGI